jgi:hypothetical protein
VSGNGFLIPPDAVRVWRGFRAPSMALSDFFTRLGTVFVPATVEMQVDAGLDGYLPSVPAGLPGKPDTVPDETAILFWDSQQTYRDGFDTLAVRTYTLTHAAVYTPASGADFPLLFSGALNANQPYHLVAKSADWMKSTVLHLIAARPSATPPADFRGRVAQALSSVQTQGGILGAIACAGDDYLAYWVLGDGGSAVEGVTGLARLCDWSHVATAKPMSLDKGLWDKWPGMTIASGDSFNMQFRRRWER